MDVLLALAATAAFWSFAFWWFEIRKPRHRCRRASCNRCLWRRTNEALARLHNDEGPAQLGGRRSSSDSPLRVKELR